VDPRRIFSSIFNREFDLRIARSQKKATAEARLARSMNQPECPVLPDDTADGRVSVPGAILSARKSKPRPFQRREESATRKT
jgi:hypothetical protein